MKNFEDYNKEPGVGIDEVEYLRWKPIETTGMPEGFNELPLGRHFVYILVRSGRVIFVSAGRDPWAVAMGLKAKFKADRILYQQVLHVMADGIVAGLIDRYQPPYNFKAHSIELAELSALLGEEGATAAQSTNAGYY